MALSFQGARPLASPVNLPFGHVIIEDFPAEAKFYGDCKGVGDIDGDGYTDVVFAGRELAWYRWPDWKKTVIAKADQEFTTDMQTGDIDGDGDPDLIVPDGARGAIYWFENPKSAGDPSVPAAWKRHLIGEQGNFAHDIEVTDMDADGRLDVVSRKDATLLWLQRTPGTFTRVEIASAIPKGEGSALADIDGDGRIDIVQNGYWLKCPKDPAQEKWTRHEIAGGWPRQMAVTVYDVNADGRPDVLFAPAESYGRLSLYVAPPDPASGNWTEQIIDAEVGYFHTFKAADVNNDGQSDIVAAEMHQSRAGRVLVYYRQGSKWVSQVIANTGSHNLRVADIGGDGDIDILGANWGGPRHPLEMWENKLIDRSALRMDAGWVYTEVDRSRGRFGDSAKPGWVRYFGLAFGDVNGDKRNDIISGRYVYADPEQPGAPWRRHDLGLNVDAMLALDADRDGRADLIGEALPNVYWLRPKTRQATEWDAVLIGVIPPTDHANGQGYALATLWGKETVLLSGGDGIYAFEVSANPNAGNWPKTRIADDASEEGIGVGDIDGDGHIDIAISGKDGHTVLWWKNPGEPDVLWSKHEVGSTVQFADRVAVADLNGDRRPDIIVTEESPYSNASVYWFEQPAEPDGSWRKRTIVTQYTTNSMDVYDMNGDGAVDILTGEHRGARRLTWWENRKAGRLWVEHVIDTGKESHLGARVFRIDARGGLAIASIAWDTWPMLHLWERRDGARSPKDSQTR